MFEFGVRSGFSRQLSGLLQVSILEVLCEGISLLSRLRLKLRLGAIRQLRGSSAGAGRGGGWCCGSG
jgi:hypothetical protein